MTSLPTIAPARCSDRGPRRGDPRPAARCHRRPPAGAGHQAQSKPKSARCSTSAAPWRARRCRCCPSKAWCKTERNRGAFVANPTPEEARQVFAVAPPDRAGPRRWPPAQRITPDDIAALSRRSSIDEAQLSAPSAARAPGAPKSRPRAIFTCCWPRSPATPSCSASWRNWSPARRW